MEVFRLNQTDKCQTVNDCLRSGYVLKIKGKDVLVLSFKDWLKGVSDNKA